MNLLLALSIIAALPPAPPKVDFAAELSRMQRPTRRLSNRKRRPRHV